MAAAARRPGSRLTPLSPIEAAIHQLFELGFEREPQRTRDDATFIAGAEWWVQQQRPRESIGYHYDKDEALASAEMTMRFPEVSTVTYLRERGGPTMVLNQTTPDGNEEIPPLPRRAWINYRGGTSTSCSAATCNTGCRESSRCGPMTKRTVG